MKTCIRMNFWPQVCRWLDASKLIDKSLQVLSISKMYLIIVHVPSSATFLSASQCNYHHVYYYYLIILGLSAVTILY